MINILLLIASAVTAGKVLKKRPLFAIRKGWRTGGRGRLSYNIGQKVFVCLFNHFLTVVIFQYQKKKKKTLVIFLVE